MSSLHGAIEPIRSTRKCQPPAARRIRPHWHLRSVVLAGLLVLSACGDDGSTGPTPTIPLSGAEDDSGAQEAFATVESAFAAFNSGDMDTWALWREGGQGSAADFDFDVATGSRLAVERCSYRGLAEWDMEVPLTGHGFDCAATRTDDILGAAGIELEMTYVWVIGAAPDSSQGGSNEDFEAANAFLRDFRDWLAASHPDVEAGIEFDGDTPTAASVPTVIEYVDEFVAQSDSYPLTEPVPEADYYGGPLTLW